MNQAIFLRSLTSSRSLWSLISKKRVRSPAASHFYNYYNHVSNHQFRFLSLESAGETADAAAVEGGTVERRRRQAIQAIPYWLKTEAFCFERTVSALNLNARSTVPSQYHKAYRDSLPSFLDMLIQSDEQQLPTQVVEALDQISHAGFHDSHFAGQFRDMKGRQLQIARDEALLERSQRKLQKRIQHEVDMKKKIQHLEQEIKDFQAKKQQLLHTTQAQDTLIPVQHKAAQLDQQISRLQRHIDGQTSHLRQFEIDTQTAKNNVDELLRQRAKNDAIMSSEVYQKTQLMVRDPLLAICDYYAQHIQQRNSDLIQQYQNMDANTDLTKPHEWYPYARLEKRKIIYHGGPTNSGKTYNALQRLMQAKQGLYLGPLRLLAAEVYEKLNSQGVYTSLVTGQEKRVFPFSTHIAATVEMAGLLVREKEFDVVVIDEIQMIEDEARGFAWTRALLGLRCKEIHLCGGLEAKGIVKRIVQACGDDFELHKYERFSDLNVASQSLARFENQVGSYRNVQAGDCIVAFSRTDIFAIKREIEAKTKHKCCVIYGSLPPEIRTTQAKLFNDPDSGYDVLVASDAIAMGLNLNIRRIIFNSLYKFSADRIVRLGHSEVKQIAGRAGRRNSPFPEGEVTCRDPRDMPYLQECMTTEIDPVKKAGLIFTASHIEMFAEAFQQYHHGSSNAQAYGAEVKIPDLHTVLKEFSDMAVVKGDYFLCKQHDMMEISKWLEDVPLEIRQKYEFCMAPVSTGQGSKHSRDILVKFGQKLSANEVPGLPRGALVKQAKSFEHLGLLCSIFSEIELFIWLQNKFPPVNYMEQQAALLKKETTASLIALGIQEAEKLKLEHCYIQRDVKLRNQWEVDQRKLSGEGIDYNEGSDSRLEVYDVEEGGDGSRQGRRRGRRDKSLYKTISNITL